MVDNPFGLFIEESTAGMDVDLMLIDECSVSSLVNAAVLNLSLTVNFDHVVTVYTHFDITDHVFVAMMVHDFYICQNDGNHNPTHYCVSDDVIGLFDNYCLLV